ncbi:A/G-specific adenine glycosylase [Saccharomonospora viridis]|jgi:A/G-specific adenine glycosylase|uniref:Adenine DNA glycosylase n=2 Tax=Saccharomonospora viridis TaxID=1852 RepID=C7MQ68_SACVD|nr:A/G-specific adenine glycosylase [Saccharomonospora viridis]ACU98491.1 A/G-specific DNA glycosylase [Saccharomonospora viridis DSM 43017]KHF44284.1 adenine glycosylase [Saccharomonospora viridis]SFP61034.1 A/G-specific DNA-adenine glycosylase [Saccharomonospora viridis]
MSIDPQTLLDWFDANARDLPWRHADCTPWGVLVSEIMLQQTPVARVLPVWRQWMERWPKPADLAAASQGEVLRAWGKLGYPRRALRLHTAANTIVAEHGGEVPADVDTLLSLPGIGAYTARAVAAFAYGRRAPVVDTNVRRVVARAVHGAAEAGPPSTKRDLDDVEALLPDGPDEARAARFSAALMELGALVCIARKPRCDDCPLFADCAWQKAGRPAYTGPTRPTQRYSGTDRHVRGLLLDVLRGTTGPVEKAQLDLAWPKAGQRDACLASLLSDGLVEQTADGRFALPGEH